MGPPIFHFFPSPSLVFPLDGRSTSDTGSAKGMRRCCVPSCRSDKSHAELSWQTSVESVRESRSRTPSRHAPRAEYGAWNDAAVKSKGIHVKPPKLLGSTGAAFQDGRVLLPYAIFDAFGQLQISCRTNSCAVRHHHHQHGPWARPPIGREMTMDRSIDERYHTVNVPCWQMVPDDPSMLAHQRCVYSYRRRNVALVIF